MDELIKQLRGIATPGMEDVDERTILEAAAALAAAQAEIAQLREALGDALVVMTADTVGTYRMDDPDWYDALWGATAKARAALAQHGG